MPNHRNIIIVSVILVVTGIGISFYQSQIEMEDITSEQQSLDPGASMTVSEHLDPAKNKNGVYSVQMSDFKNGFELRSDLLDPNENVVASKLITRSVLQENFTVSQIGNYTLHIENTGKNQTQTLGIIGYYPQGGTILDVVGIATLIGGLTGLGFGMMYLIKRRGKNSSS